MKYQKLLAGLLAFAMTGAPMMGTVQELAVFAEETAPTSGIWENLNWSFDAAAGTLTISGEGDMTDDNNIGNDYPWHTYRLDIRSVIIENGVTSIGEWAFRDCVNLTDVTIPDTVAQIGGNAFSSSRWLAAKQEEDPLVIMNGILIDGTACSGAVTIPDGVTSIAAWAFSTGESALTAITIPDGVTSIGDRAFEACTSLTSAIIPSSVTSIGEWAFFGCYSLTDIIIPNGVTSIGQNAFGFCKSLTAVTIPESVTSIGFSAFYSCTSLTSVTILNPDCAIRSSKYTFTNDDGDYSGVIRGYANSTAQSYAAENGRTFEAIRGNTPLIGDVNSSGKVDASDAAELLIALANIGAGTDSGLTEEQTAAADADGSGALDAGDAAVILQYAAYLGSGGTGTLPEFLNA